MWAVWGAFVANLACNHGREKQKKGVLVGVALVE